jgi:hypothetical protein
VTNVLWEARTSVTVEPPPSREKVQRGGARGDARGVRGYRESAFCSSAAPSASAAATDHEGWGCGMIRRTGPVGAYLETYTRLSEATSRSRHC